MATTSPHPGAVRARTLSELRDSGWESKSVKQEIHDNFLQALLAGDELFPGIIGYDDTVIPEINIGLLAQHDMLFLGEKGQAKSRLMRLLVRFLDEEIPYSTCPDLPVHEDPLPPDHHRRPATGGRDARRARSRSPGGRASSGTPSGFRPAPSSPT